MREPIADISVMHVVDSLEPGGLERVAVNIVNNLPRGRYDVHLCATRREGALSSAVLPHVHRLSLRRRGRFDLAAFRRLVGYIRQNRIGILHAHGTSLFIAVAASSFRPFPAVVWHDHFGRFETEDRPAWLYRLLRRRIRGVIAVNRRLAEWSIRTLGVTRQRVAYIPNFVCEPSGRSTAVDLPGHDGSRIVCVANLRAQKDHPTLLAAMERVLSKVPHAYLLLVGNAGEPRYVRLVQDQIQQEKLHGHVAWLGARNDVEAVLQGCDIGVLSSQSEGLPLALLEYGMAGLPAVATSVGQCEEVLQSGRAGVLVSPSSPGRLADAIISLLKAPDMRAHYGKMLQQRVHDVYGMDKNIERITGFYDRVCPQRVGRESS
jgi:glycosyltransferase involved in cell wall biosynthesis